MRPRPRIVFVGGFLGAGKTTLILRAAGMLQREGVRVAVITNDQGENLLDTQSAIQHGVEAAEIGGGCFCCRFGALLDAADALLEYEPEVIFAEPVGSCTDLVATVLQPLQTLYPERFQVAPLTVIVDPGTAERALRDDADPNVRFLFENQIREADLLCYSKSDVYERFPKIGCDEPLRTSALTGDGVRVWLETVLAFDGFAGGRPLTIDYDRYAAAEAALGWLNAQITIELRVPVSPAGLIGPMLDSIDEQLTAAGSQIAHLKISDQTSASYIKAAIVRNREEPSVDGDLLATAERRHEVLINLRAIASPEQLRHIVERAVAAVDGDVKAEIQAFAPGYPKPEHRLSR